MSSNSALPRALQFLPALKDRISLEVPDEIPPLSSIMAATDIYLQNALRAILHRHSAGSDMHMSSGFSATAYGKTRRPTLTSFPHPTTNAFFKNTLANLYHSVTPVADPKKGVKPLVYRSAPVWRADEHPTTGRASCEPCGVLSGCHIDLIARGHLTASNRGVRGPRPASLSLIPASTAARKIYLSVR